MLENSAQDTMSKRKYRLITGKGNYKKNKRCSTCYILICTNARAIILPKSIL